MRTMPSRRDGALVVERAARTSRRRNAAACRRAARGRASRAHAFELRADAGNALVASHAPVRRERRMRERSNGRAADVSPDDRRSPSAAASGAPTSTITTTMRQRERRANAIFHGLFGYSPWIAPVTPFCTHWKLRAPIRVGHEPHRRQDVLERLPRVRRVHDEIAIGVARNLLRAHRLRPWRPSPRARAAPRRPGRSGSARRPSRRRSPAS